MANSSSVVLIFGAGSNIGQHVAQAFASKGYKVARVARKLKESENTADQVYISGDLSDPNTLVSVFAKVKALLGVPSVVIYNGESSYLWRRRISIETFEAAAVTSTDANNPLSLSLANFTQDLNINTTSAFFAAQQAVLAFEQLPDSASRTFIYTGNILNTTTMAPLLDLGVGKSATAHIIESAAGAYKDRGFKYVIAPQFSIAKKLIAWKDFIMPTSARLMAQRNSTSMEKRTGNYI